MIETRLKPVQFRSLAKKETEMDQPANTNNRESSEPDEQELTPGELEELSGGVLHTYTPPDPC
jgi:hypothetical protein